MNCEQKGGVHQARGSGGDGGGGDHFHGALRHAWGSCLPNKTCYCSFCFCICCHAVLTVCAILCHLWGCIPPAWHQGQWLPHQGRPSKVNLEWILFDLKAFSAVLDGGWISCISSKCFQLPAHDGSQPQRAAALEVHGQVSSQHQHQEISHWNFPLRYSERFRLPQSFQKILQISQRFLKNLEIPLKVPEIRLDSEYPCGSNQSIKRC